MAVFVRFAVCAYFKTVFRRVKEIDPLVFFKILRILYFKENQR